jgi:hypothetical protein
MGLFYVHVYETYRTKWLVEADSMEAACEIAVCDPSTCAMIEREPAEEVTGFLVDEVGDTDYVNTKGFDPDYQYSPEGMTENTMAKLAKFVLYALTNDDFWDSSTLEGIAYEARKLGLAGNDEEGMFVGQTPEAIECRRLQRLNEDELSSSELLILEMEGPEGLLG